MRRERSLKQQEQSVVRRVFMPVSIRLIVWGTILLTVAFTMR